MNRFSVPPLLSMTRELADVASGREPPELVISGARILSTYSERILPGREVWIYKGRIAAVKSAGSCSESGNVRFYDQGRDSRSRARRPPHPY